MYIGYEYHIFKERYSLGVCFADDSKEAEQTGPRTNEEIKTERNHNGNNYNVIVIQILFSLFWCNSLVFL